MKSPRPIGKTFAAAKYGAAGLLAGSSLVPGTPVLAAERPPNIVFILADDLSWTGINCHNIGCTGIGDNCTCSDDASKWDSHFYETPNIRNLIRNAGVRFTRAYVCPTSGATRVGIMTGKCPLRFSYGGFRVTHPPTLADVTIAEALDLCAGDYVSAIVGKGHLSYEYDKPHPRHYDPCRQGFDYQFAGSWTGMGGNLGARHLPGDQTLWRDYWEPDPDYYGAYWAGSHDGGWYQEDPPVLPDQTSGIRGLYFPGLGDPNAYGYWTPNMDEYDPNREYMTDALGERAVQFLDTFKDGKRNQGKPFFLYLPFFAPHAPINPLLNTRPQFGYTFTGDDDRHDYDHNTYYDPDFTCDPNDYAAMTKKLDDNIGKVLDAIDDFSLTSNTIVIFLSDNGGVELPRTHVYTENHPLREGKGSFYEGGIRVPLIVKWPGVAPADTTCDVPVNLCDFLPTIVNMAQGDDYDPDKLPLIDGTSFVPLLKNPTATSLTRENNFFVLGGGDGFAWSVIFGTGVVNGTDCSGYKLVKTDSLLNDNPNNYTYELYAPDDLGEDTNLVDNPAYAAVAGELRGALENWLNTELRPYNGRLDSYYRAEWNGNYLVKGALQKAVEAAVDGDTIQIPPATFLESGDQQGAEGLKIGDKELTLRSRDPNDWRIVQSTVIARKSRYGPVIKFTSNAKKCTIDGVTITGGCIASGTSGFGAGICGANANSESQISRCIICYNYNAGPGAGGGIHGFSGTVSNCIFRNNTANGNGGALADCDGPIRNCLMYANTASQGGAMSECDGPIRNCTVVGNIAVGQNQEGGGLYGCKGSTRNSILAHNVGHAIYEYGDPDPNVQFCTFYGNKPGHWYDSESGTKTTAGQINGLDEAENNLDVNPAFTRCFAFVDHIKVTQDGWSTVWLSDQQGSDQTTIPLEDVDEEGYEYSIGDIIEFNNDGVTREIIDVNSTDNTITFTPAYLMEDKTAYAAGTADQMSDFSIPSKYVVLYNWGNYANVTSVIEDFHLLDTSPCINAGDDDAVSGETDIDGDDRLYADQVDIGADEASPLARRIIQGASHWYYKIQEAIEAASNGEIITVYPGLYRESLDFTGKSVTVEGSDPNNWETIAATIIDPNAVE